MKYLLTIHKSKYGYDIHVPALPGCHSQGSTEKEAMENIQDAIMTYLDMEKGHNPRRRINRRGF